MIISLLRTSESRCVLVYMNIGINRPKYTVASLINQPQNRLLLRKLLQMSQKILREMDLSNWCMIAQVIDVHKQTLLFIKYLPYFSGKQSSKIVFLICNAHVCVVIYTIIRICNFYACMYDMYVCININDFRFKVKIQNNVGLTLFNQIQTEYSNTVTLDFRTKNSMSSTMSNHDHSSETLTNTESASLQHSHDCVLIWNTSR